jgi:hypothetical protein
MAELEFFSLLVEFVSGTILLTISFWAFLSFKLRTYKYPFIPITISAYLMVNSSFLALMGTDRYISELLTSVAILLLAVGVYLMILASRMIGLGR